MYDLSHLKPSRRRGEGGAVKPTTVYRLRDADGALLYVGIAGNPGRRFEQHAGEKPWWGDVATVGLAHYESREAAAAAEMAAIKEERPRYNVVGNRLVISSGSLGTLPAHTRHDLWTFQGRSSGHEVIAEILLGAEVNGTSMSDDWLPDEITASDLFRRWQRKYVGDDGWVDIYWHVAGNVGETAPFQQGWPEHFLTYYTWPVNAEGQRLNWNRLPVLDGRWYSEGTKGGFFQEHTGWKPAPFQARVHVPTVLLQAGLA
jgi:predicted GIY-YIG superfamily endonuclease